AASRRLANRSIGPMEIGDPFTVSGRSAPGARSWLRAGARARTKPPHEARWATRTDDQKTRIVLVCGLEQCFRDPAAERLPALPTMAHARLLEFTKRSFKACVVNAKAALGGRRPAARHVMTPNVDGEDLAAHSHLADADLAADHAMR